MYFITFLVNSYHNYLCLFGFPCLTVKAVFNNKHPYFDQFYKFPCFGFFVIYLYFIKLLNIFFNDGGISKFSFTENARPVA
jgi:hypothetical protein